MAAYHQGANVSTSTRPASHKVDRRHRTVLPGSTTASSTAARGSSRRDLAEHSVPVWNGLTDEWHPTQSLCDMFTMRRPLDRDISFMSATPGSTRAASLIAGAMMAWTSDRRAAGVAADPELVEAARSARHRAGDRHRGGLGGHVDFVHTDIWVSMAPKEVWADRTAHLTG